MSFSDQAAELERSFRRTAELLQQLLAGLQARRAAWISARSSVLTPSPELEALTQSVAREESLRAELLARMRQSLPTPIGAEPEALHLNVTRIADALPRAPADSLRAAADAAKRLAKAVRGEVTLGQRLLQFSRRAQIGGVTTAAPGQTGYDRRARTISGAVGSSLIDGRM